MAPSQAVADDKSVPVHESRSEDDVGDVVSLSHLHRTLDNRQIQLIAIGGSIGESNRAEISFLSSPRGAIAPKCQNTHLPQTKKNEEKKINSSNVSNRRALTGHDVGAKTIVH